MPDIYGTWLVNGVDTSMFFYWKVIQTYLYDPSSLPDFYHLSSFTKDNSNNTYYGFTRYPIDSNSTYPTIIKNTSTGELDWQKQFQVDFGVDNTYYMWDSFVSDGTDLYGILIGYSYDIIDHSYLQFVKITSNGTVSWIAGSETTSYYRNQDITGHSSVYDAVNSALIYASSINPLPTGNNIIHIVKYSTSGSLIWEKTITASLRDLRFPILGVDSLGNLYVALQNDVTPGQMCITLMKLNSTGSIIWQTSFYPSTTNYMEPISMSLDDSNNIYLSCYYTVSSENYNVLIKFDSSGNRLWNVAVDQNANQIAPMSCVAADNGVYVSYLQDPDAAPADMLICKFNSAGILLWQNEYTNYSFSKQPVANYGDSAPSKMFVDDLYVIFCIGWYNFSTNDTNNASVVRMLKDGSGYNPTSFTTSTLTILSSATTVSIGSISLPSYTLSISLTNSSYTNNLDSY